MGECEAYDTSDESFSKSMLRRNSVPRRYDGEDVEHDKRPYCGNKVYRSSTKLVNEERETEVFNQRKGFHAAVDAELCLRIRKSYVIHHILQVV